MSHLTVDLGLVPVHHTCLQIVPAALNVPTPIRLVSLGRTFMPVFVHRRIHLVLVRCVPHVDVSVPRPSRFEVLPLPFVDADARPAWPINP